MLMCRRCSIWRRSISSRLTSYSIQLPTYRGSWSSNEPRLLISQPISTSLPVMSRPLRARTRCPTNDRWDTSDSSQWWPSWILMRPSLNREHWVERMPTPRIVTFYSRLSFKIVIVNKEVKKQILGPDWDPDSATLDCHQSLIDSFLGHATPSRKFLSKYVYKFSVFEMFCTQTHRQTAVKTYPPRRR